MPIPDEVELKIKRRGGEYELVYVERYNLPKDLFKQICQATTSALTLIDFDGEVEVDEDNDISIIVWVRLNSTFASTITEAESDTEVNVTISGGGATGWSNHTLSVATGTALVGSFYYIKYGDPQAGDSWQETGHPAAGQTYDLKIYYYAYY